MKTVLKIALAGAALVTASAVSAAPNILTNGSFETGDFTGYTQFGTDQSYDGVSMNGFTPTNGVYQAYFGNVTGTSGINKSVTTVAGQNYLFSYDIAANNTYDTTGSLYDFYAVSFNNVVLDHDANTGSFAYGHHTFTVTGTGNDVFSFGFQNVPGFFGLDNLSLTAVPEPSTWAMMIVGFGLVGAAARRRKSAGRTTALTA